MFLRYFAHIEHPVEQVTEALLGEPNIWLPVVAEDSMDSAARMCAEVGLDLGGHRLQRHVDLTLGTPVQLGGATVIPIEWVDRSHAALFPDLEADLEIASLGSRTQLSMNVRYDPPLGILGTIADRAVLHRVAEATVKDFVDQAARRLHMQVVLKGFDVKGSIRSAERTLRGDSKAPLDPGQAALSH